MKKNNTITCNKKCLGCAQTLNTNKNQIGYTPKLDYETKYCYRCYRFKYYNESINPQVSYDLIKNKLESLDLKNSNVFLVVDVLDLPNTIIDFKTLKSAKTINIILNKIDKLPFSFNHVITNENVKSFLESINFKYNNLIYTSILNKSSIKRLFNKIKEINKNEKIYFIGKSNTGKSSLINELLKLNENKDYLTTSPYINTTLDFKKIKITNYQTIIDSPGFIDDKNILNYIDFKYSKKIINKNSSSKNYFLNIDQSLIVEKLFSLNFLEGQKSNFTLYLSKELKVMRSKIINSLKNLNNKETKYIEYKINNEWITHYFELNENKKYNLCINGICTIVINPGVRKISLDIQENIGVFLNEFAII